MTTVSTVVPDEIHSILKNILANEKFQNPKITFRAGSSDGEGFIAVNVAIEVTEGSRLLNLFIKTAPKDPKTRQVFLARVAFVNEIRFYETIYPAFSDFFRIRSQKTFDFVSKFYGASEEELKELVVLENLRLDGFDVYGAEKFLSADHVQLVMQEYGKFHAISFAMKEQEPEIFTKISKDLPDLLIAVVHSLNLLQVVENRYKILKRHWQSPEDDNLLEILNDLPNRLKETLSELENYDGDHQVLIHGDCWSNNMMFRKKDGQLELRLIDFQGIKLASFAADLCYVFYASAGSETNLAQLNSFLDIYYESLSSTIKDLGSDPARLCPRHIIDTHWKKCSMFGLLMGSLTMPLIAGLPLESADPDQMQKPLSKDTGAVLVAKEKAFARIMKPFIQHFISNGFI